MSQPASARLDFLKASARLLSQQSPSTSAHLMTMHNSILLQDKSSHLPIKDQMDACPSCGSVRIPGVNSRVFTRTQTPPKTARSVHKSRPKAPSQDAIKGQSVPKCLLYMSCLSLISMTKKKLYVMNIFNFLSNLSVTHKRKNLEFISIFLSLKEGWDKVGVPEKESGRRWLGTQNGGDILQSEDEHKQRETCSCHFWCYAAIRNPLPLPRQPIIASAAVRQS